MHIPVLLNEVLEYLDPKPGQNFIDCTIGSGGHAMAILERIGPNGKLLGIDLDGEAIEAVRKRIREKFSDSHGILRSDEYVGPQDDSARSHGILRRSDEYVRPPQDDIANVILIQDNFKNLKEIYNSVGASAPTRKPTQFIRLSRSGRGRYARKNENFDFSIHGILLDLGFCSDQIENGVRGFSFTKEGPLRMNYESGIRNDGLTAEKIVNEWTEGELVKIFKEYGEERQARRIARAICQERKKARIKTTRELVDLVCWVKEGCFNCDRAHGIAEPVPSEAKGSVPTITSGLPRNDSESHGIASVVPTSTSGLPRNDSRNRNDSRIHPATKVFQALRIAVNDELNNLKKVLPQAIEILQPSGKLAVISFHSLEDRIVKDFFKKESKDCLCPPEIPVCCCDHKASLRILTKKVVKPTRKEVERNPRARSARMRVGEKK